MPYTITDSADGCSGWAVVKEGSNTPIPGGCHKNRADALAHMVAVGAAYQSGEEDDEVEEPEEEGMEYESRQLNLVAPGFMRASARRGLALHEEGESGGGLRPQTVEDARKMANGDALSEQKWRKIGPWIARHIVDLDAVQGDEITPGLVAMLLWGGGSSKASARRAQQYAERLVARLDEEKRFNPEQPRDDDGKFSSDGGGGSEGNAPPRDKYGLPTINDDKANEVAQIIRTKKDRFAEQGGSVEGIDEEGVEDAMESARTVLAAQKSSDLTIDQQGALERGHKMTQAALSANQVDNIVVVARDGEGRVAGAVQFSAQKIDPDTGIEVDEAGDYLKIEHLGSLGTVDGVGSALTRVVFNEAAGRGVGVVLEPWGDKAKSFWEGMGFKQLPGASGMYLTADSTRKISDRLGE
jgi:hypothetical protein